jgi:hypothetical protein
LSGQNEIFQYRVIKNPLGDNNGHSSQAGHSNNAGITDPSLAQTDSLSKLLIEKGLITQVELMQKLSAERVGYQAMLREMS